MRHSSSKAHFIIMFQKINTTDCLHLWKEKKDPTSLYVSSYLDNKVDSDNSEM